MAKHHRHGEHGDDRVLLFWIAFVFTRPFDATFGDLPTKPVSHGGLNPGTTGSSLVLAALLAALVAWGHHQQPAQDNNVTDRPILPPG